MRSGKQLDDFRIKMRNKRLAATGQRKGPKPKLFSQLFQHGSASANDLMGDPPTLMAGLLIRMGRQEATKPGRPRSPGPLLLSLLITNEKSPSLALHISNSAVAGPTRLKCSAI